MGESLRESTQAAQERDSLEPAVLISESTLCILAFEMSVNFCWICSLWNKLFQGVPKESLVGRHKLLFINCGLLCCRASSPAASKARTLMCSYGEYARQTGTGGSGGGKLFSTIQLACSKQSHQLVIKMYLCILNISEIDKGKSMPPKTPMWHIFRFAYVSVKIDWLLVRS